MNAYNTALAALVASAAKMTRDAASHLECDAGALAGDTSELGTGPAAVANFAVGALLPVEKLAADLQAILAAARALQFAQSR